MIKALVVLNLSELDESADGDEAESVKRGLIKAIEQHRGPLVVTFDLTGMLDRANMVLDTAQEVGGTLVPFTPYDSTDAFEGEWGSFLPWLHAHLRRQGTQHVALCGFWDWEETDTLVVAELLEEDTHVSDVARVAQYLRLQGIGVTVDPELTMIEDEPEEEDEDEEAEGEPEEDDGLEDDEDDGLDDEEDEGEEEEPA